MRRLVWSVLVLAGLLALGDRVALAVAEHAVAAQLQRSAGLAAPPSVGIGGFPFLTQAVAGRYDSVTVTVHDLPVRGQVRVSDLTATLTGAEVPLRDALGNRLSAVPVSGVTARALLSYGDLERASGSRALRLTPEAGRVRVSGSLTVLGLRVQASVLADVTLSGDTVRASGTDVLADGRPPPPALAAALRGLLELSVRVGRLPFGLSLTGVHADPLGVTVSATTGPAVLAPVP